MNTHTPLALALCTGLVIAGCGKKTPSSTTTADTATASATAVAEAPKMDPAAEAKKKFKECVVCHGEDGKGDGPGAAALNPKPRDYTDAKWQDSITDEQIAKTIIQGGAAVGKSPAMPPHPELKKKPEVVKELVKIIRGFKGK